MISSVLKHNHLNNCFCTLVVFEMSLKISVQASDDMPVGASRITGKTKARENNQKVSIKQNATRLVRYSIHNTLLLNLKSLSSSVDIIPTLGLRHQVKLIVFSKFHDLYCLWTAFNQDCLIFCNYLNFKTPSSKLNQS